MTRMSRETSPLAITDAWIDHWEHTKRYLRRRGVSEVAAEDLASEARLRTLRRGDAVTDARAYMLTAAKNLRLRQAKQQSVRPPEHELDASAREVPDTRADRAFAECELSLNRERFCKGLRPEDRGLIGLLADGLTGDDIARQTGSTPEAVRQKLTRLRRHTSRLKWFI